MSILALYRRGPARDGHHHANVDLRWTGPSQLQVRLDEPDLQWQLSIEEPRPLRWLNAVHSSMPFVARRSRPYARLMELMARSLLGMGAVTLHGTMPSGHLGVIMPRRILFIGGARATLRGSDLGTPARVRVTPRIGTSDCLPGRSSPSARASGGSRTRRSTAARPPSCW